MCLGKVWHGRGLGWLVNAEEIKSAREWIQDCQWQDLEECEVSALSDADVIAGIRKHYDGGIAQFISDSQPR